MTSPLQRIKAQLGLLGSSTGQYALPDRYRYQRGQTVQPTLGMSQLPIYWQHPLTTYTPSSPIVPGISPPGAYGPNTPESFGGDSAGGAGGGGGGSGSVGDGGFGFSSPVSNAAASAIGMVAGIPGLGLANAGINAVGAGLNGISPTNPSSVNAVNGMDADSDGAPMGLADAIASAMGIGLNVAPQGPSSTIGGDSAAPSATSSVGVGAAPGTPGGIGAAVDGGGIGDSGVGSSSVGVGAADGTPGGIGAVGGDGTEGGSAGDSGGGGGGGGGCYMTEAITRGTGKEDDALELEIMRAFRDHYMMQNPQLAEMVHQYYGLAPKVVAAINQRPDADELYSSLRERFLLPGVKQVLSGDPEAALKTYADMLAFASPFAESYEGNELGAGASAVSHMMSDDYV